MLEVIVFPDATATIADRLAAELTDRNDDTPVVSKVPDPRPTEFVLVRRTGGISRAVVVDDALVTIESWGPDDETAHDRAQLCRGILLASVGAQQGDVVIYRVTEVSGPGNLPDPVSEHPRYSQTFSVALRGAVEPVGS